MRSSRLIMLFASAAIAIATSGCQWLDGSGNTQFTISTQGRVLPSAGCPPSGCAGYVPFVLAASVTGTETQLGGNPEGEINFYDGYTDVVSGAWTDLNDPIVNAYWSHEVLFPTYCQIPPGAYVLSYGQGSTEFEQDEVWMANGSTFQWICNTTQLPPTGPASRFAYVGNIPSSITLPEIDQADSFSTAYGPPILNVYNGTNGTPEFFTTVTASSVSASGDSATFPLPSSMPSNAYMLVTANEGPNGTYSSNAYNAFIVASSQTIQGNPLACLWARRQTPIRYARKLQQP